MSYFAVKSVFRTIQGEGLFAGTPAVFVRMAGCNVWTGREEHRFRDGSNSRCANFCDTDFVGTDGPDGGTYTPKELASVVLAVAGAGLGPRNPGPRLCVVTGGEPMLQLGRGDAGRGLALALHTFGFRVAVETNGSLPIGDLRQFIHVCVSPKPPMKLVVTEADEVKVLHPAFGDPERFRSLIKSDNWFLQPVDDRGGVDESEGRICDDFDDIMGNIRECIEHIQAHPGWRLSLQTHKLLGLP